MGYYINKTTTGEELPATGKVALLLADGARIVEPEFQENLVCVVQNGFFEAAGYCYSKEEFRVFNNPDDFRPKIWLVHPQASELAE